MTRGLEALCCEDRLRESGSSSLEKGRLRGRPHCGLSITKGSFQVIRGNVSQ